VTGDASNEPRIGCACPLPGVDPAALRSVTKALRYRRPDLPPWTAERSNGVRLALMARTKKRQSAKILIAAMIAWPDGRSSRRMLAGLAT
jgi:hypothetical protein